MEKRETRVWMNWLTSEYDELANNEKTRLETRQEFVHWVDLILGIDERIIEEGVQQ